MQLTMQFDAEKLKKLIIFIAIGKQIIYVRLILGEGIEYIIRDIFYYFINSHSFHTSKSTHILRVRRFFEFYKKCYFFENFKTVKTTHTSDSDKIGILGTGRESNSKIKNGMQVSCVKHTGCMMAKKMTIDRRRLGLRVSTGIPGYGLRTEMIREFFPFPSWKRFRKFPECCSGILFWKIPVYGTIFTEFSGKRFRKTLKTS